MYKKSIIFNQPHASHSSEFEITSTCLILKLLAQLRPELYSPRVQSQCTIAINNVLVNFNEPNKIIIFYYLPIMVIVILLLW